MPRFEISTPSPSKPKPSTRGAAAGGDDQPLAREHGAALQVHLDPGRDALDGAAQVDVDALAGEHVAQERAGVGVVAREQAVGDVGQRDLRAHAAEELGELAADRARAEDDDARRDLAHGRGLAVRPVVDLVQTGDGRDRRHRAGRDHEPLVAELAARRLDESRLADHRLAAHELDVAIGEPLLLRRVVAAARHLVAVPEDARGVELSRHGLGGAGCKPRGGERLGRTKQRLRRHARVVGALAADELALDERDPGVGLEAAQRAGEGLAGRAAADDEDVAGHRSTVCPPPRRVTPNTGAVCSAWHMGIRWRWVVRPGWRRGRMPACSAPERRVRGGGPALLPALDRKRVLAVRAVLVCDGGARRQRRGRGRRRCGGTDVLGRDVIWSWDPDPRASGPAAGASTGSERRASA